MRDEAPQPVEEAPVPTPAATGAGRSDEDPPGGYGGNEEQDPAENE